MEGINQLIHKIYDAALDPSAWSDALIHMEHLFLGTASGLYSTDEGCENMRAIILRGVDQRYIDSYVQYYAKHNPWRTAYHLQRPGVIRTDSSFDEYMNTPGAYTSTELFNDWMKPQGFIHSLGTNLLSRNNTLTKFYMYRPRQTGAYGTREIELFRQLAGHLTNAMEISHRLAIKDSQLYDSLQFMDRMTFGVVFLDRGSRILHANRFAERLFCARDGLQAIQGAIVTEHKEDSKKLASAIQAALMVHQDKGQDVPKVTSVRRSSGKRPFCVIAAPLPRQSNPFLLDYGATVLLISDPELEPAVHLDCLRRRYALSLREAQLAQHLARGTALREAAAQIHVSYETARGYLKIIFQKTGTQRQPELVRRLLADQVLIEQ